MAAYGGRFPALARETRCGSEGVRPEGRDGLGGWPRRSVRKAGHRRDAGRHPDGRAAGAPARRSGKSEQIGFCV